MDPIVGYSDKQKGKLILGGGDDSLYKGPLMHIPFVEPYALYLVNINVGISLIGEERGKDTRK